MFPPFFTFSNKKLERDGISKASESGIFDFKWDFEEVALPIGLIAIVLFCSLIHIYAYKRPKLASLLPESCFMIIIGLVLQGFAVLVLSSEGIHQMSPHLFQVYLLPLIMLDAGLSTQLTPFTTNFGIILALSFLGTLVIAFSVGGILWFLNTQNVFGDSSHEPMGLLLFTTVISAVDPVSVLAVFEEVRVNQVLYIIVFGESILNDAVTIVMYDTLKKFLVIPHISSMEVLSGVISFVIVISGGLLIGVAFGIFISYLVTKTLDYPWHSSIIAIALGHLAYLMADGFNWSGVVAIFFYSLTCTKYMAKSLSMGTMSSIRTFNNLLARSAEAAVFILLGVSTLKIFSTFTNINWIFVALTILLCFICRTIVILLFVGISNCTRVEKISAVDQFIMCYGGLRGAIAYALMINIPANVKERELYEATTILLIYFTVFIVGATVKPLTKILDVKKETSECLELSHVIFNRTLDEARKGMEAIAGNLSIWQRMKRLWKRIDYNYLSPWLIKDFNKPDTSLQSEELQEAFNLLFVDELKMDESAMHKLRRYRYRFYRNAQHYRLRHNVEPSVNQKQLAKCVAKAMFREHVVLEIKGFNKKE